MGLLLFFTIKIELTVRVHVEGLDDILDAFVFGVVTDGLECILQPGKQQRARTFNTCPIFKHMPHRTVSGLDTIWLCE